MPASPSPHTSAAPPASVLIALCSYNGGRWLGAQLDSIAAQDHSDWALWISDDGSSDDTRTVIAACSEGDSLRMNLAVLKRFTKFEPVNSIELRRGIAKRLLEAGKYVV